MLLEQVVKDVKLNAPQRVFNEKFVERQLTVNNLRYVFAVVCEEAGYGRPPELTQEEERVVRGVVKSWVKNGVSLKEVQRSLVQVVKFWDLVKGHGAVTKRGKKMAFGAVPRLPIILACWDDVRYYAQVIQRGEEAIDDWTDNEEELFRL